MGLPTRRAIWWWLRRVVVPLSAFLLFATQLVLPTPAEAVTITYRSAATAVSAGEGVLEIATPKGVEPGDLLLAQIVAVDPEATITPPPGWSLLRTDRDPSSEALQAVYFRIATADQPGTHAWADNVSSLTAGGIAAYTGVDPANPIAGHRGSEQAPDTDPITVPGITAAAANSMLVGFYSMAGLGSIEPPKGMVKRWNAPPITDHAATAAGAATAPNPVTLLLADQTIAEAGDTGPRFARTKGGTFPIGQLVALNPLPNEGAPSDHLPAPVAEDPPGADETDSTSPDQPVRSKVAMSADKLRLPMAFEENHGQVDGDVDYLARGRGYSVLLDDGNALLALGNGTKGYAVRMSLVDGGTGTVVARDRQPGIANYFLGDDPNGWRTNVPTFAAIEYLNVYPGIDLRYYGNDRQLEYDFIVHPGADPAAIGLTFDGTSELVITDEGDLEIGLNPGRTVTFSAPITYQRRAGEQVPVDSAYVLDGDRVVFSLGHYDPALPLIIDPTLDYGSYVGGSGTDSGSALAIDGSGRIVVAGYSASTDFPATVGAYDTSSNGSNDVFVAKFDTNGSTLQWATYLGGSGLDNANGIDIDAAGAVYIGVYTASSDFPTTAGAHDTGLSGLYDGAVVKLSADGATLVYSTYLGGSANNDYLRAIAVDGSGQAVVGGATDSSNYPTVAGSYDTSFGGNFDAFVTKVNTTGTGLVWSTFIGGTGSDGVNDLVLDGSGTVYVTGQAAAGFPTTAGAYDSTVNGTFDGHATKLSANGSSLLYSTVFGGSGSEDGTAIAFGDADTLYIAGDTPSSDFPTTAGAYDTTKSSSDDIFALQLDLNQTGTAQLAYSTFIGGAGYDRAPGIAVDGTGRTHIAGWTQSSGLATAGAYDTTLGGTSDTLLAILSPDGATMEELTYVGGDSGESTGDILLTGSAIWLTGNTSSAAGFPTTGDAYDSSLNGTSDGFVVRFASLAPPSTDSISGTVFEDITGDALNDGTIGDANNPGADNVDVFLYLDDGDVNLDAGDTLIGAAPIQTDVNGDYSFTDLANGDYFVVVDSKTVAPSQDPTAVAGDIWAEQTYGPIGGYCDNGIGYSVRVSAGPCYAGIGSNISDDFSQWDDREHRALVSVGGGDQTGIDFGFSFNVVTNTNAGSTIDHDTTTNRTVQGSLRQFIQNANAISGVNAMRFVPAEPAGAGDGSGNYWWRLMVTSALPAITGDGTTIDGRAFDFTDGSTVLDTNAAQIGAGLAVGTAGTHTTPKLDPELEIRNFRPTAVLPTGLVFEASDAVLRHVSIWGFGNSAGTFDTNVRFGTTFSTDPDFTGSLVEFNVIGTGPASFADPGAADRSGQKNLAMRETDNAIVRDNLIGFAGGVGVSFSTASSSGTVLRNEIRRNGILNLTANPVGVWVSGNVTGNLITDNSAGVYNGSTPAVTYQDNTITANGWGATRPHGIWVSGSSATIRRNVIADNAGAGVMVQSNTSNTYITRNSIYGNGTANSQIGIDLLATGDDSLVAPYVTANDSGDGDTGGNALLNHPVLDTARIEGTDLVVTGWARPFVTIDLYIADPDPTGFGEGKTWLVSLVEDSAADTDGTFGTYGPGLVNGLDQGTDTTNRFSFTIPVASLAAPVVGGDSLTSLATSGTNTSEFGGNVLVPAPFVVNSTGDASDANAGNGVCETATPGQCTLRAAIEEANALAGTDSIEFNIPTSDPGYSASPLSYTIQVGVPSTEILPAITEPLTIDGTSQPGFTSTPVVVLDGTATTTIDTNGITLEAGNSTVRGLSIVDFPDDAIELDISGSNTIVGNYVGILPGGAATPGNGWGLAIKTSGNTIGGTTAADRNVIAGNDNYGLAIYNGSANNLVQGNYIGVSADGSTAAGNGTRGIEIYEGSNNNTIGGTTAGARNVISGNTDDGIYLQDVGTDDNIIRGNYIGTNAAGDAAIPNGDRGVQIESGADDNTVGGTAAGALNVISGNGNDGVVIGDGVAPYPGTTGNAVEGNHIGVAADGTSPLGNGGHGVHLTTVDGNIIGGSIAGAGNVIANNNWAGVLIQNSTATDNSILRNSIYSNGGIGIDLGGSGVTPNDGGDDDFGANDLLNFPVITRASEVSGAVTVDFDLDVPDGNYRVEFFDNTAADGTGNGEGETWVSSVDVSVTGGIPTPASHTFAGSAGDILTATATEGTSLPFGSTSEFSAAVTVVPGAFVVNSTGDAPDLLVGDGTCTTGSNIIGGDPECTLRAAIEQANDSPGADTIAFDIPTTDTGYSSMPVSFTIQPDSPLPVIDDEIHLDGTTQSEAATQGRPVVRIDGSKLLSGESGLGVNVGADGSELRGLILSWVPGDAIHVESADDVTVAGNYIGTDATGMADQSNGFGIRIRNSDRALIGGTDPADRNVVSGTSYGVLVAMSSADSRIIGNYIGLDATGTAGLGNSTLGVMITATGGGHEVGGSTAAERNVISANPTGVYSSVSGVTISGNYLGTDADGTAAVPNLGSAISLSNTASGNTIGGTTPGERNIIAGNTNARGIELKGVATTNNTITGNWIGIDRTGAPLPNMFAFRIEDGAYDNQIGGVDPGEPNIIAHNSSWAIWMRSSAGNDNSILGNSIHSNGAIGINLGDDNVTLNDVATGPNDSLNFPVITSATGAGGSVTVALDLDVPAGDYRIEFFTNTAADPTGYGEGETFVDVLNVVSHPGGPASYGTVIPGSVGDIITATTTEDLGSSYGSTSEFSAVFTVTPGPFVVNSTRDGGDDDTGDGVCHTGLNNTQTVPECTLRAAIEQANATPGTDAIEFDIPTSELGYSPSPVAFTIQPATLLPAASTPMIIDATTQPQFATAGRPVIELNGSGVTVGELNGFHLTGGDSTLRGFVINNWDDDAIDIEINGGNTIAGNFVGTDVTGTTPEPNAWAIKITSADNIVGGTAAADRNVVSGNTYDGIYIHSAGATGNQVQGNYVGTTATGIAALGNGTSGIYLGNGASGNTIGGDTPAHRNVISGNAADGVRLEGLGTSGNTISGNYIGANSGGGGALPNGGEGIAIDNASAGNLIGGTTPSAANLIAHNGSDGVNLKAAAGSGNSIIGNSIFGNSGWGIDLAPNGTTLNDPGDTDPGPNGLLNFPVIDSAYESGGVVTLSGTFDVPVGWYRFEFFNNTAADGSGYGEGETLVGSTPMTHTGSGAEPFGAAFPGSLGDVITATLTECVDSSCDSFRSTSEFSAAITVTTNLPPVATDDPPAGTYVVTPSGWGQWDVMGNDSDPNGDTLHLSSFTQPSIGTVIRVENGTPTDTTDDFLRYTAPASPTGPTTFTYTISDGFLTDTATVFINVQVANNPPIFGQDLLDRTNAEGTLLSLSAPATDADAGDTLTYSATGLPLGLTIDGGSGLITGIVNHAAAASSPYSVEISVCDDGSPTRCDTDSFTWTIANVVTTPPYLVAGVGGTGGGDDLLTTADETDFNPATNEVDIGTGTGTSGIRAAAVEPISGALFAVDDAQLGVLNPDSGQFTPVGASLGTGDGTYGSITFDNITGITFHPLTGEIWAVHSRPGLIDVLLRIDPVTGAHVPDAFGAGVDYRRLRQVGVATDFTGIAFDPTDWQLYGSVTDGAGTDHLVSIKQKNGNAKLVGPLTHSITDLSFDDAGQLWGVDAGALYQINKANGTLDAGRPVDNGSAYEALAFAISPASPPALEGTVFEDLVGDALAASQAVEDVNNPGVGGVTVNIYRDNGAVVGEPDSTDTLFATKVTGPTGHYYFEAVPAGRYWLTVESSSISPTAGGTGWAEQTYGPIGAVSFDGSYTVAAGAGPLFGGKQPTVSDSAGDASTSEHLARLDLLAGDYVEDVDFGFSFNVVVNAEGGATKPQGSLRRFIDNANVGTGPNTMRFVPAVPTNSTAGPGTDWWSIPVTVALDAITDPATIVDGTAYDAADGVTIVDANSDGPELELDGGGLGGIGIETAAGSTEVRDLVVNGFDSGIAVLGGNGSIIAGNYLGPDATGLIGETGNRTEGVLVYGGTNTVIGGTTAADRNVISGNHLRGIFIDDASDGAAPVSDGTQVIGNYIGTDGAGTAALPYSGGAVPTYQQIGIAIWGGPDNVIGTPSAGNVISGNEWHGVYVWGADSTRNKIQGNTIGLDATATSPVPNGYEGATRAAINLTNAIGNLIGGDVPGEGNTIQGNASLGIAVFGTIAVDNAMVGNSIHDNGELGIDLGTDGVTLNDPGDGDTDVPNGLLNFPVITSAVETTGTVAINFTLDVPVGDYRIEFYSNTAADPSGYGEGEAPIHSYSVVAHPGGSVPYSTSLAGTAGTILTATTTEDLGASYGSTSEFSASVVVTVPDTTAPVITLVGADPVTVEAATVYLDAGATAFDAHDGDLTGSIVTTNPVNTGVLGTYTVRYNVTDSSGNAATEVTRTVNVVDTVAPVITLVGSSPIDVEAGTVYLDAGATAFDAGDGDLTAAIVTVNPVDTSTLGSYTVTYNVTDSQGHPATEVTRVVNVIDTTPPVITLVGSSPIDVEAGTVYLDAGATASDSFEGNLTAAIFAVNPVNTALVGTYTITYTVSDSSGNTATPVTRIVNVIDTTPPVIALNGSSIQSTVEAGTLYLEPGATASDIHDGDLTSSIVTTNSSVDTSTLGTYTVRLQRHRLIR